MANKTLRFQSFHLVIVAVVALVALSACASSKGDALRDRILAGEADDADRRIDAKVSHR